MARIENAHVSLRLVVALVLGSTACQNQGWQKLSDAEIPVTRKAASEAFARKALAAMAKQQTIEVGDEASPEFRTAFNSVESQKRLNADLLADLGRFQSLVLHEVWKLAPKENEVYRFKAVFEKQPNAEVRVNYAQGMLIGWWVTRWKDEFTRVQSR